LSSTSILTVGRNRDVTQAGKFLLPTLRRIKSTRAVDRFFLKALIWGRTEICRMADENPPDSSGWTWPVSLAGLGLFTFALVALSGPGRIDNVDGQTRFEVGQSLVEHGDSIIRDERVWWVTFPGRNGQRYTNYRFPHSVVAAAAIAVADATGPVNEGRRHFFFLLSGAVACGLLSMLYAIWFRKMGQRPGAALLWAFGGIVCTPVWFYGTCTFDDFIGITTIVAALVCAQLGKGRLVGAIVTGLLLGLAFNAKQPLVCFALVALALNDEPAQSRRKRLLNALLIAAGAIAGVVAEQAYDAYKFPSQISADLMKYYGSAYGNHQLAAFAVLSVSLGAGAVWYFPPMILCLIGVGRRWTADRRLVVALILSSLPFLAFICSLSFFKGDLCWGPRYLTPWFAILWLFAPWGAAKMRTLLLSLILFAGFTVQVLALSVDMHRLYIQKDVSGFGKVYPWLYFNPELSHLCNRPREIIEIARDQTPAAEYSPSLSPTFTFPVFDPPYLEKRGPDVVLRYRMLNSFRPWWASMSYLSPEQRPVDLGKTAMLMLAIAAVGGGLVLAAAKRM
jgi:hypothetical protein